MSSPFLPTHPLLVQCTQLPLPRAPLGCNVVFKRITQRRNPPGDALSAQHFQKYSKLGYDVAVVMVNGGSSATFWAEEGGASAPGRTYFERWKQHHWPANLPFVQVSKIPGY